MSRARRAAALICAVATALAPVAAADAAERRGICAKRATMRDSPRGFTTGYLYRPERVQVLHYDTTRRWAAIRARTGRFGWVARSSFCPKEHARR